MPLISIPKLQKVLQVEAGANLMDALLRAGLPVASSCDGEGVCSKCRIRILQGSENLSARNEVEIFLMEKSKFTDDFRISCQTHISGDITVEATYW